MSQQLPQAIRVWIAVIVIASAVVHPVGAAQADTAPHERIPIARRPLLDPIPPTLPPRGIVGRPTGSLERDAVDRLPRDNAGSGARSVFPPDERVRVSPAVASIAFLESINQAETAISECTGTFIAPDVLLTAAHCLYSDGLGGWASNVWVTPGMDGYNNDYPFGYDLAENYWVPNEWYASFHPLWDFGLIKMSDGSLGYQTGWFEIGVLTTESLSRPDFYPTIIGYPGDKPHGTQWIGSKPSFVEVTDYELYYDIDTYSGQSGSAVMRGADGLIVGIHSHGGETLNDANRIEQFTLEALLSGCSDMGCAFAYLVEEPAPGSDAFDAVWRTTDALVAAGQAGYSWFWGPAPNDQRYEPYQQSPNGERLVRYYDKSRMEITNPFGDPNSIWFVTNGLLTVELVTGRVQVGDAAWQQRTPAWVPVAGDLTNNPGTPSYATFAAFATTDGASYRAPDRTGQPVTQFMSGDGRLSATESGGVTLAHYRPETGHNIAGVFWSWANSPGSGLRPDQGVDWLYVLGFPISEPYWIDSTVGGTTRRVLVQLFERRALTYTPDNPAQFRVEFGNIGLHYYHWRYGEAAQRPTATSAHRSTAR